MNNKIVFVLLLVIYCLLFNNNVVFCKYPYLYSFTNDNQFQLVNIETNQLMLNQTLPSSTKYSINTILQKSNNGDGFTLFVLDKSESFILDYNFQSNQISRNKTGIKNKFDYQYKNQQFLYYNNNVYIAALVEHQNKPSIVIWDIINITNTYTSIYTTTHSDVITLNDDLYDLLDFPLSTIDYNNGIYYYLYFHNGTEFSQPTYIQTFKIGENGNPNTDFQTIPLQNQTLTSFEDTSAMYYTSYGNIIVVSHVNGLSICQLDLTQGECTLKYSAPVGSYTNNFVNYFMSADNSQLIHMDGMVDNSDYIVFNIIDLLSYTVVNTTKSTNYYLQSAYVTNFYL